MPDSWPAFADSAKRRSNTCAGSRPAATITRVAEGENVDVIMLSTHGLGGMEDAMVGSVADRVIQQTHRPVLLVPIRERKANATEE